MFFTPISKLYSSCYLSAAFNSNMACLSSGPFDLGTVCTALALLTRLFASLIAMITAFPASITDCVIACVMLCSTSSFCYGFCDTALCECVCIYFFYFVVCLGKTSCLLPLLPRNGTPEDDNMIMISYICTRMCLHTIAMFTDDTIMNMCPCLLLATAHAVCHWPGIFLSLMCGNINIV